MNIYSADQKSLWYVTYRGEQVGPINFSKLQDMLRRGELSKRDMAWTAGMDTWVKIELLTQSYPGPKPQPSNLISDSHVDCKKRINQDSSQIIRTNRALIAILLGCFICISIFGGILAGLLPGRDEDVGVAIFTIGAFGYVVTIFVYTLIMVYRMWKALPNSHNSGISPGRAVGFCFIPLFNIYWMFRILPGWATIWNTWPFRKTKAANYQILLMDPILTCCSIIPILNFIALPLNLFVLRPIWIFHVCGLLNEQWLREQE